MWRLICRIRGGCLNSPGSTRLRPIDRLYYELNFRSIDPRPTVGLRARKEGEKCRSLDHMKQIHKNQRAARCYHERAVSEMDWDRMAKGMWKPVKNVSESTIAFKIQNLGSQKTQKSSRSINWKLDREMKVRAPFLNDNRITQQCTT